MLCLGDKGSLEGGGTPSLLVQLQGLLGSVPLADPVPTVSPWGLSHFLGAQARGGTMPLPLSLLISQLHIIFHHPDRTLEGVLSSHLSLRS